VDGLLGFSSCLFYLVLRRVRGFCCCSPRFKLFLLHARESPFLKGVCCSTKFGLFLALTFVKLRGSRMQEDWRDYYGYGVGRAKNNQRFMSGLPNWCLLIFSIRADRGEFNKLHHLLYHQWSPW
jgi:hypothetical protein